MLYLLPLVTYSISLYFFLPSAKTSYHPLFFLRHPKIKDSEDPFYCFALTTTTTIFLPTPVLITYTLDKQINNMKFSFALATLLLSIEHSEAFTTKTYRSSLKTTASTSALSSVNNVVLRPTTADNPTTNGGNDETEGKQILSCTVTLFQYFSNNGGILSSSSK